MQEEILEIWFQLLKTQSILDTLIKKAKLKDIDIELSLEELKECEKKGFEVLKSRFPNARLKK